MLQAFQEHQHKQTETERYPPVLRAFPPHHRHLVPNPELVDIQKGCQKGHQVSSGGDRGEHKANDPPNFERRDGTKYDDNSMKVTFRQTPEGFCLDPEYECEG